MDTIPALMQQPTPGFLVWRLSMKWRAAVDRAVSPLGLTHAQYSLLASLYGLQRAKQRPSQRELADHTGLEPLYVSRLARALESAGLIERAEHPTDTRAVQLSLTDHGTQVARQAIDVVAHLLDEQTAALGGTSGKRTRAFIRDLEALLAHPSPPSEND
jgi:DNA-binding MarR family transcriptional regulator